MDELRQMQDRHREEFLSALQALPPRTRRSARKSLLREHGNAFVEEALAFLAGQAKTVPDLCHCEHCDKECKQ